MRAADIRGQFIRAFSEWGHTPVPSAPLIPHNDPTLLFVNAGMVQFKSLFLGSAPRPYARAVSAQKCVRAGGKHNDLENVGQTHRHHTFFEMLGNFSFGDYFKKEAIAYAWEFLTRHLLLDPARLWVTVYRDDDEAAALWKGHVAPERIVRLGEVDNFWQMGETGPCGPCSEILFDQGEAVHPDCPGIGHCDCDRYLEIWNLVFMQYNKEAEGQLVPLPAPSIDTGMGLERIAAVCQGMQSNYQTDLFRPLFAAIALCAGRPVDEVMAAPAGRVIADHLRAITFLISDGIFPGNEGRGYLLRRILRRAARFGKKIGLSDPFLHTLTGTVVEQMQTAYPELSERKSHIARVVLNEEERFIHTLNEGTQRLSNILQQLQSGAVLDGQTVFTLYDTYGFPVDLTEEIAREEGFTLDQTGFQAAMAAQKERARRSWTGTLPRTDPVYESLWKEFGGTPFTGYERLTEPVTLLGILKEGKRVDMAEVGETVELLFDRTPFYGEAGGQVGDCGKISASLFSATISDTVKPLPDLHIHRATLGMSATSATSDRGALRVGSVYQASVDEGARRNTARNHTATHLLHAALREALGDHVQQAGSRVAPDRLRFDFRHFAPLTESEIARIERRVNEETLRNVAVRTDLMEMNAALHSGAMALFGEKYGEQVRVVCLSDFSRELCGGTHCAHTGEIGFFKIVREGSVASGIRRIEAVTGIGASAWVGTQTERLREVAALLRVPADEAARKLALLLGQLRDQEREIERLRAQSLSTASNSSGAEPMARTIGGVKVLAQVIPPATIKEVRAYADRLRDRLQSGVIVVGAPSPQKDAATLVVMVTSDCRLSAADLVRELAIPIEGTGGGSATMAQAGGKKVSMLGAAVARAFEVIAKQINQTGGERC
jgi:alanyl-tRNA synthetase